MKQYFLGQIDGCGCGIGHKLYTYLSTLFYSKFLNLEYCCVPFPTDICWDNLHNIDWEEFFSLGLNEITENELIKNGYIINKLDELNLVNLKNHINQYNVINNTLTSPIIWKCTFPVIHHFDESCVEIFRRKYNDSPYRQIMKTTYSPELINITIHIRRGDYIYHATGNDEYVNSDEHRKYFQSRMKPISYYTNIMDKIIELNCYNKPILFHLYTEQNIEDINIFRKYNNINIHMNNYTGIKQIFTDFVNGDIIIGSESAFTLITQMINNKILLYPEASSFPVNNKNVVYCNNEGYFNENIFIDKLKQFNLY